MTLYCERIGNGPKVVLLHGWGFNGAVWHQLVEKLKDQFEFIIVDLPGFGRSANYTSDYQLHTLANDVAAVMDDDCIVIGWSMGGIIAQQIAIQHSKKMRKLVLLACNAQFIASDAWPYAIKKEILNTFSNNLLDDYKSTLHRFLTLQARGGENMRETVREMKQRLFEHGEPNQQALISGLQLLSESSFIESLPGIKISTLIMQGRLDALVPAISGKEMIKLLPNGQYYLFEKAAHAPFVSHINEFSTVLDSFIKS